LFLAAALITVMLVRQRPKRTETEHLSVIVPISAPTISRWQRWWGQTFTETTF
jgi:hypothetical protein